MQLTQHLPAALRALRQWRGLSQRAAARRTQLRTGAAVTQSTISQWETGKQMPALASLDSYLSGLGLSLVDLLHAVWQVRGGADDVLVAQVRQRLRNDPSFLPALESMLQQR